MFICINSEALRQQCQSPRALSAAGIWESADRKQMRDSSEFTARHGSASTSADRHDISHSLDVTELLTYLQVGVKVKQIAKF